HAGPRRGHARGHRGHPGCHRERHRRALDRRPSLTFAPSSNEAPGADVLLVLAAQAAREAGALLLRLQHVARTEVGTKSSATDMVTDADRASERLIVERLLAARPGDAILGEEGGDEGT